MYTDSKRTDMFPSCGVMIDGFVQIRSARCFAYAFPYMERQYTWQSNEPSYNNNNVHMHTCKYMRDCCKDSKIVKSLNRFGVAKQRFF